MNDILHAKIDTAVFGPRRWYVDGYKSHWFTSKEDAEAAIGLANQVSINECREMEIEIKKTLDRIVP